MKTSDRFYRGIVPATLLAVLCLFLINGRPQLLPPMSGYTEVNVSVGENGESRVNIPIALPKGTILAPEINIGYNSQAGNGLLGQGFQLEGLYTISRSPANLAQDGLIDGVDFDSNDRFSLNGERLVKISTGAYGGNGTEYRTEQNNFSRVRSFGVAGIGPAWFKVWTKSGLIMEFGNTADSRIEAQGRSEAMVWLINRITDTKGNYITFSYIEENTKGEFRLDKIRYTGHDSAPVQAPYNTVQFNYENRPDSTVAYLVGSKIGLSKRLTEIVVQDNGVQYRRYELTYSASTDLGLGKKSFLTSVKEFGVGNVSFSPTTFKWTIKNVFGTVENPFSTNTLASFSSQPERVRVGDLTGDGKMDALVGPEQNTGNWYLLRSTGASFVQETWATNTPAAWRTTDPVDQLAIRLMDVNADGLLDVCVGPDATGKWEVMKSTGTGFGPVETWLTGAYGYFHNQFGLREIYPIDADGDGRQDIILGPDGSNGTMGNWYYLHNTGTSFVNAGAWVTGKYGGWSQAIGRVNAMDVNGDGLTDFVLGPEAVTEKWYVLRNTGSALVDEGAWATGAYAGWSDKADRITEMDFDGDGLTDFVLGPEQSTGKWYLLRNHGTFFENAGEIATGLYAAWYDKASRMKSQDLNGDGLSDFLFGPEQTTGNWYCMYNTGKGFELGYDGGYWMYNAYASWWDKPNLIRQMDMNGDGVLDICFGPEPTSGKWEMMSNRISEDHPYLLGSVTNGHGATTSFGYKELTRNEVYQKGTGAVFPKMDFVAPLFVTSEVRSGNGIGGKNRIYYKYYDAKLDLDGRGFRGFGKTEQIDSLRGTKNVVVYERQHQFLSTKVGSTEQWLLNYNGAPKLLSSTETILDTFEYFNKTVHFSFIQNSTEKSYDLNSTAPFKTKITTNVYDQWGDVSQITEEQKAGTTSQYTVVTTNTYAAPDTVGEHWILGRLTLASVTKTLAGKTPITKQSSFQYEPGSGILKQEILNSTNNLLKLQKDYSLDAFGNRLTETVTGPNISPRTNTFIFDGQGRNVISAKNALNQEATYTYLNGLPNTSTDANGLTETVSRDAFGRPTTVFHPDGTQTSTVYYQCDGSQSDAPALAVYYLESEKAGSGKKRMYYDLLDREIRSTEYGLDGQLFFTDTEYDEKGLVSRKSDPYRDSPTWHTFLYDAVFRLIQETAPGNIISSVQYAGLTTTTTNAQAQNASRSTNAMGWLVQSKDHQNNTVNYDYDSDGNLTTVTDPAGNVTTMSYDSRGNKTSMDDPDLGILNYTYNTLGLLTKQSYPGGHSISITYDLLDRKIRQVEKKSASLTERTLGWSYDLGNKGIGRVTADSIDGVVAKQYLYDDVGRMGEEKEKIENVDYSTVYEYDNFGRIRFLNYPGVTDFKLRYNYDSYGHLKSICQPNATNGNCATTFWQLDSLNNRGQVTKYTLGNGLSTRKSYDDNTGYLQSIRTGNGPNPNLIQNLAYQFSLLGNLTQRRDLNHNLTEDFQYDNLNRLTQAQVAGQTPVTVTYNTIGNILSKSNVGTYSYGANGAGPHMVTSIDHSGVPNCFYGFQGTVGYTVYNYPRQIIDGQDSITFTYGADRAKQTQRLVKNGALVWKKRYINGLVERVEAGSVVKTVLHIQAMGETVAELQRIGSGSNLDTLRYVHYDHLGSLQSMSRADGSLEQTFSFDAWGKARLAVFWEPILTVAALPPFQRGFTMHETMGIEDLIHMNARLYDPAIGRFLSADPFVQEMGNLQNLNRASYVLNNPLSYTDPTGFNFWKNLRNIFKAVIGPVVAIALNFILPGVGAAIGGALLSALGVTATTFTIAGAAISIGGVVGSMVSGAIAGFGGAFVGAFANGGNIGDALRSGLQGGLFGGLAAGLASGVGDFFGHSSSFAGLRDSMPFGNAISKGLAHGISSGIISVLRGDDFGSGFATGLAVTLGAGLINDFNLISSPELRIVASAVIGGTVSKLTGGSFANGAITGAFIQLYNEFNLGNRNADIEKRKQILAANNNRLEPTSGYRPGGSGNHEFYGAIDFNVRGMSEETILSEAQSLSERATAFCQYERVDGVGRQTDFRFFNGNVWPNSNSYIKSWNPAAGAGATGSHIHCDLRPR